MKEETIKRQEKIKEKLIDLTKEAKRGIKKEKGFKKLTTQEMNKKILDLMTKKNKEKDIEDIEEVVEKVEEKHRKFKCASCGILVEFYGDVKLENLDFCLKCNELAL
jgi:peroxiredoxin family protein